jgi:hypothetical protein
MATPMPPLKIEMTSAQKVFELIISPNEYDNLLNHIIKVKYPPTNAKYSVLVVVPKISLPIFNPELKRFFLVTDGS